MTTATIQFVEFPFAYKGFNFVSKIAETSRYLPQIKLMGEAFIDVNKGAVDELINIEENPSVSDIEEILKVINLNGTEMFIELRGI